VNQLRDAGDEHVGRLRLFERQRKLLMQVDSAATMGFGVLLGGALGADAGFWWAVAAASLYFAFAGVVLFLTRRAMRGVK
jgi:hypothetical protein